MKSGGQKSEVRGQRSGSERRRAHDRGQRSVRKLFHKRTSIRIETARRVGDDWSCANQRAPKNSATGALVGIWAILLMAFVIAVLYVGRDILIPIALAALITFCFRQ